MAKVYDPEQLNEAENKPRKPSGDANSSSTAPGNISYNSGGSPSKSAATDTSTLPGKASYSSEVPDSEKSLYTSSSTKPGRLSLRGWGRRKKALIGGGIATAGVGGALAFFTFFSGPLQFVHFAQLLQKFHFSNNENTGDGRSARMIIYTIIGQGNRTRLGVVTNKYVDRWEDRIVGKTGLRPVYTAGINSRFVGFKVENDKLARDYLGEFENEGINTRASPTDVVDRNGNRLDPGDRFVSLKDEKFRYRRSVVRNIGNGTDTNKIVGTVSSRLLIKRGGVDFGPLKNIKRQAVDSVLDYRTRVKDARAGRDSNGVTNDIGQQRASPDDADGNGVADGDETDRAVAEEANRQVGEAKAAGSQGAKGNKTLKSLKAGVGKSATPIVVVGALCTIKTFGNEAEALQHQNIVLPMMRIGFRVISTGSQVMSGQNVNLDELGALAEDLNEPDEDGNGPDKGSTWTAARSIQAELGQEQTGPDIPIEAKPARVGQKPAVFDVVDRVPGLGGVCGIYSAIGGLPIIKQASTVASEAFIRTTNVFLNRVGTSVEGIISGALGMAAGRAVDPYAQGADLGNLANYGARLAANDQALAMGGREMTASEIAVLDTQSKLNDSYEYSRIPVAKRLLDPYDSASPVAKLIDKMPSTPAQIPEQVASLPKAALASISSLFSLLSPRVQAASDYDYGFPEYGFSAGEQSDERFENPFENAAVIEPRLPELNTRYGDCFSMTINPDTLQLENGEAVRYDKIPEKCKNTADEDLLRYRFYLLDSVTARSLACYEGDEESCGNIGISSNASGVDEEQIAADSNFTITKIANPLPAIRNEKITPKGVTLHWWGGNSGGRGIDTLIDGLRGNTTCPGGCSVQLGITSDGRVYQLTNDLLDLTWHAPGGNQTTIGIEIEGGPDEFGSEGIEKYPQKFEAVVATVKYLVKRYDMQLDGPIICGDTSGIHPHKAFNGCPPAGGKTDIDDEYFNAVMRRVRQ